jgi:drug/metabolite transporter (DMT)-like permease
MRRGATFAAHTQVTATSSTPYPRDPLLPLLLPLASLALLIVRVTIFNGELQLPATEMQWAVSVATGVFGGAAPFILYLEATRRIPTTTVSQFSTLVPVVALIGGVIFLNDVTTPVQLLGTAIVVVSLSLLARYARAH